MPVGDWCSNYDVKFFRSGSAASGFLLQSENMTKPGHVRN